ncbi:hypothetical protein [Kocuria palustris]|uniref:hypothetical protein n=1 Tax=Kocuria palustris TaxID=71999 RepID=UPI003CEA2F79
MASLFVMSVTTLALCLSGLFRDAIPQQLLRRALRGTTTPDDNSRDSRDSHTSRDDSGESHPASEENHHD